MGLMECCLCGWLEEVVRLELTFPLSPSERRVGWNPWWRDVGDRGWQERLQSSGGMGLNVGVIKCWVVEVCVPVCPEPLIHFVWEDETLPTVSRTRKSVWGNGFWDIIPRQQGEKT